MRPSSLQAVVRLSCLGFSRGELSLVLVVRGFELLKPAPFRLLVVLHLRQLPSWYSSRLFGPTLSVRVEGSPRSGNGLACFLLPPKMLPNRWALPARRRWAPAAQ
jgi:hypothetical protein